MSMLISTLRNLFSRPDTIRYPKERTDIPSTNRGRVVWDMQRCIWCRMCEKNCPTKAIVTDKERKTQTITRVRCIACRTCVDVCPVNIIKMESVYSKPGPEREVHVYGVDMAPFEYRVERMPASERDVGRLRKGGR
jgi:formate hydrogenlyase subunit 6/NADH:ubiquinone oxidoreductase subunit I